MKLNILNLPHRQDRLETLTVELQRQRITDFHLWNGIIDKELPCRGISKAHKQIVRYAKQKGLNQVLIAEDDIRFSDIGAFQFYLNHRPLDFDIYLGGIYNGELGPENTAIDFTGFTLYMVHERFYDTFLSAPEEQHIDVAMKYLGGKYVVCNPFVVSQYQGFSDNQRANVNYNEKLMSREFFNIMWHNLS